MTRIEQIQATMQRIEAEMEQLQKVWQAWKVINDAYNLQIAALPGTTTTANSATVEIRDIRVSNGGQSDRDLVLSALVSGPLTAADLRKALPNVDLHNTLSRLKASGEIKATGKPRHKRYALR